MSDFAEVVDRLYGAQDERDGWRCALDLLARHCEARSALLMVHERATGRIVFPMQHGLSDEVRLRLSDLYRTSVSGGLRRDDLRLQDLLSQPVGAVRTDTMLADYGAYLSSAAYHRVYARLGTEHVMGGFVSEREGRAVAVRLFRSRREGAFRSREIRRYERLVPHLERSIGSARARIRTEQLARLLTGGAILPGVPFCIVDETGGVVLSGADGDRLLGSGSPEGRTAARLVLQGAPTIRQPLQDGRELIAWRVPDERPGALPGIAGGLCVLTAVGEQGPAWRARRMARTHRLTPAETRLLETLCVLESPSLITAAQRLGIARETAKTQLRAIFQKTGVGRQAELLRRVMLDSDLVPSEGEASRAAEPGSRDRGARRSA